MDETVYEPLAQEFDAIKQGTNDCVFFVLGSNESGSRTRSRLESHLAKERKRYAQGQLTLIETQIGMAFRLLNLN